MQCKYLKKYFISKGEIEVIENNNNNNRLSTQKDAYICSGRPAQKNEVIKYDRNVYLKKVKRKRKSLV